MTEAKVEREEEARVFLTPAPEMFDKRYSLGLTNPFDRFTLSAPEYPVSEVKKRMLETPGLKKRNSDDLAISKEEDPERPKKKQDNAERRRGMVWGDGVLPLDEEKIKKVEEENRKLQQQIDDLKRINAEQQKQIENLEDKTENGTKSHRRQSVQMSDSSTDSNMLPPSGRKQSIHMTDSSTVKSRRQSIHMVETSEKKSEPKESVKKSLELVKNSSGVRSSKELVRPSRSVPNITVKQPVELSLTASPPNIFSFIPDLVEYEQNHSEETIIQLENGAIAVQAGTTSQLVNRLFGFRSAGNFCKEFLLTSRYFVDSESLLQLFEEKMSFQPKNKEDPEEVRYFEMNREAFLNKFSNVLTWWIEINKDEVMKDQKLSVKWNSMMQKCPHQSSMNPKPSDSGRRRAATIGRGEKHKSGWFTRSGKSTVSFSDIPEKELAEQLCLHEMEMYKAITLEQLKCENWYKEGNREKNAADVHRFTNWFNEWSYRMAQEILQKPDQKHRISAIKSCIKLGMECRELNNFNGVMEVVACMNIGPITRLKKTWKEVPEKYVNMLKVLSDLMETAANFKSYRNELSKAHRPLIPYLGLTLRDFVVIEDANPTTLDNGFINFDKMRMLANSLTFVHHCQGKEYSFIPNLDILEYLQQYGELLNPLLSYDQLMELSLSIEPSKFVLEEATPVPSPVRAGSHHSFFEKIAKVVSPTARHSHEPTESAPSSSDKKKNWRKSVAL